MKITTWNINSVRLRLPLVLKFLQDKNPDILCLQETKCPDEFFPIQSFMEAGYGNMAISGMKGYNGVAIISRFPLTDIAVHHHCGKVDHRHISATVVFQKKLFELHNLYIPAGGPEPDVDNNPAFKHKLDFVDEMSVWFNQNRNPEKPLMLVGDLNIAPFDNDVWSHKQLLNVVSHTPIEVEKLVRMKENFGWVDVMREFVPLNQKLFTWWSYRNKDWQKSNRGRRLDHIWATQSLRNSINAIEVHAYARDDVRPSDHVPVTAEMFL